MPVEVHAIPWSLWSSHRWRQGWIAACGFLQPLDNSLKKWPVSSRIHIQVIEFSSSLLWPLNHHLPINRVSLFIYLVSIIFTIFYVYISCKCVNVFMLLCFNELKNSTIINMLYQAKPCYFTAFRHWNVFSTKIKPHTFVLSVYMNTLPLLLFIPNTRCLLTLMLLMKSFWMTKSSILFARVGSAT